MFRLWLETTDVGCERRGRLQPAEPAFKFGVRGWASIAFFLLIRSFSCHERLQGFDLDAAAEDEGGALVDGFRLEVEDALRAVDGGAAGLLGDEGERVGFVQEAELAFGCFLRGRIEEDAAFEERAVEVGDEAADVARAVGLAVQLAAAKAVDELLIGERPGDSLASLVE